MKTRKLRIKTTFYFKVYLKSEIKLEGKFMEQNLENSSETPSYPNLQNSPRVVLRKKWLKIGLVGLFGLVLLTGVFYAGSKMASKKESSKDSRPSPQVTSNPSVTPIVAPSSQEVVKPIVNQNTPVTSPEKYGFTKTLELKGIGVKAKFPQNVTLSLQEENFYVIKTSGESDTATFSLKTYDGTGRRAWFQKNYPFAKDYVFEPFTGKDHSGYIAYAKLPKDLPGGFYYFAAISSNTMLIVTGSDYVNHQSVFYSHDLQRVKSFLSTIEFISRQNVALETYPQISDLYRWSNTRKTVWEDATLGLKITTPEWIESRYIRERDANGKFTYTDWVRTYPEAKTYDSSYFSENIKRVEVTGAYVSSQNLSVLSLKYQGKTFSEVANELLIPAGFCTTEWKSSKAECVSSDYCYTRDEVVQNLIVKKQVKIGTLDAQLRNMNQDFSNKNDCRAEDTWLIKAKNGQFVLSNISPNSETIKLESL